MTGGLLATVYAPDSEHVMLTSWIRFDPLSRLFTGLFLLIGMSVTLLSAAFFERFEASRGEYFFLLLSSLFGLILIGSSADFLTLFIGLETLSLSLYILCSYMKQWPLANESAMKYFLIGSIAAAFLLYGIACIYGAVGTTHFDHLEEGYRSLMTTFDTALFLVGIAFLTVGIAFKAAIVPFHMWAPDVYEGAPTPVTAFMAVGTKVGAFAAFIRVFMGALPQFDPIWNEGMVVLVYATLIYANIVAIRQFQLRRFFAYSSISHAGFLLIPLIVGTQAALPALLFYLVVYALATLGAFAVVAFLDSTSEGVMFHDLRGLFKRAPLMAAIFSLCLLTLAGIPPTVGFFAKFYLFQLAFQSGYYGLVVVGLLTTILSAYYYLRIIAIMLGHSPEEAKTIPQCLPAAVVGVSSFAVIILLSSYPAPLLEFITSFFALYTQTT